MQKRKGISLIVLVITIIVMTILAGAIILTLNNSGIINEASKAVEETNLATVKELAQMAWTEAFLDGKTTQGELEEYILDELEKEGIKIEEYVVTVTEKGVDVELKTNGDDEDGDDTEDGNTNTPDQTLNHSGTIPEGATYTTGLVWDSSNYRDDTTNAITYNAGDAFPTTVKPGDKYLYNGYEYRYQSAFQPMSVYWASDVTEGWGVFHWDGDKAEPILHSINGEPITSMDNTFFVFFGVGSTAITSFDENFNIPETVTSMYYTFQNAEITSLPNNFAIPASVNQMGGTFGGCESLTGKITINANPDSYNSCFSDVDMSNITLAGTSSIKQELANTGENASQVTIID